MLWDIFCRVIDNHGDIGVCWRLAADLAARGERLRLWVDDASALAWMAPHGAAGVEVRAWDVAANGDSQPGDVVVEAFGCDPPAAFIARMAECAAAPCWINLEYLSAESYVERSHGLRSPQSHGPGAGLTKWFFYPGFTSRTGSLLREPGLLARRELFDANDWRARHAIRLHAGERVVSLFCYDNATLPALVDSLAQQPTLLLATPGAATMQMRGLRHEGQAHSALRVIEMPHLTQLDYDHLLWSCNLNFVRGEDSFVRAQWAGAPFVWHVYPQSDGAHEAKLEAFLDVFLDGAEAGFAGDLRALWRGWNGLGAALRWPEPDSWRRHCENWRTTLAAQPDLGSQLLGFARERR
ncbi:elongation factor P maturation arginine rhamnosyltransferase EarP [Variovorax sp. YR752]|uniref:elongation factor P maturation arginine rhamnosyltransferase EarP n=1 Tax=Variovorax sp. YR752 TaxID=1884383 RepID=UPI003137C4D9